jgi:Uma2 family endonuclease
MPTVPTTAVLSENVVIAGAPLFRISPEKYRAMVRDGILTEDDPVEYLQGALLEKMTKSDRHVAVVWFLRRLLDQLLAAGFFTISQDPIDLGDSEPEPDILILRGDPRQLFQRKPNPADVLVVIEVSDSTLRRDREVKRAVYAAAGIPIYWIVNLVENVVEVYRQPDPQGVYQSAQRLLPSDELTLVVNNQPYSISVREVLGL